MTQRAPPSVRSAGRPSQGAPRPFTRRLDHIRAVRTTFRIALAILAGLFLAMALLGLVYSIESFFLTPSVFGPPRWVVIANGVGVVALWAVARLALRGAPALRPVVDATATASILLMFVGFVPGTTNEKHHIYEMVVKNDLRNIFVAQEAYHAKNKRYSGDPAELGYSASTGVVDQKISLTPDGWAASARHVELHGSTCAIYVGSTPMPPSNNEGEPICSEARTHFDVRALLAVAPFLVIGAAFAVGAWVAGRQNPPHPAT